MSLKIAAGAGHGGSGSTPGKRTPAGEYEWNFNDVVLRSFIKEMNTYQGVEILRLDDSTGKKDVSLATRTNRANSWGADLYISFHHNANTGRWGNWTGVETFYYQGSASSKKFADVVHPALVKAYGLRDRGIKKGNHLWVIRKSTMPAILVEGGFMDSTIDIKKLRNNKVLERAGKLIAEAVAKWKGLKKKASSTKPSKPATPSKPSNSSALYRVRTSWSDAKSQKGAYRNLDNAKKEADRHSGYKVFDEKGKLVYTGKKGNEKKKTLYRVRSSWSNAKSQKGAYTNLNNAKKEADKHTGYKVYDDKGKLVYTGKKKSTSTKKTSSIRVPNVTLRRGNKGQNVLDMQLALSSVYFYPDKGARNNGCDGSFGPKTENAVRRFQAVHANPVDGIFGPKTRAALQKLVK